MWSPPENEPRRGRAQTLKVLHLVVAIVALFAVGLPAYYLARSNGSALYIAGAVVAVIASQVVIAWWFALAMRKR